MCSLCLFRFFSFPRIFFKVYLSLSRCVVPTMKLLSWPHCLVSLALVFRKRSQNVAKSHWRNSASEFRIIWFSAPIFILRCERVMCAAFRCLIACILWIWRKKNANKVFRAWKNFTILFFSNFSNNRIDWQLKQLLCSDSTFFLVHTLEGFFHRKSFRRLKSEEIIFKYSRHAKMLHWTFSFLDNRDKSIRSTHTHTYVRSLRHRTVCE